MVRACLRLGDGVVVTVSWELAPVKRPGFNHPGGSPWVLLGFALGVATVSNGVALYYWVMAPLAPLMLAGGFAIASAFAGRRSKTVANIAEGALAAALLTVTAVAIGFFVLVR